MHMYALVVIPDDTTDVEAAVAAAMEPYREDYDNDELTGWWDWYSIGGRYSGRIFGFDPRTEPENLEVCWLCKGTGIRLDETARKGATHLIKIEEPRFEKTHPRYGETGWCNGCNGERLKMKWPSDWKPYPGDIATVADVTAPPYTLVTPEGAVHKETWNRSDWIETPEAMQEAWSKLDPSTRVVVVDYHD